MLCALLFLFVVAAKGKTSTEASIIGLVAVIFSLIAVMMTDDMMIAQQPKMTIGADRKGISHDKRLHCCSLNLL